MVVVGVAGVCAAHPRSRGENPPIAWSDPTPPGSSPLTRGKLSQPQQVRHRQGLIPAHAGKTVSGVRPAPSIRAHPRSRGENDGDPSPPGPPRGSSPLTRGKPIQAARPQPSWGLIPAHAGKTPRPRWSRRAAGAHPRSRGENSPSAVVSPSGWGSSPLTRGKPSGRRLLDALAGLIPAHAGKTCRELLTFPYCEAHPRSRGENGPFQLVRLEVRGSSPLTRGKLFFSA